MEFLIKSNNLNNLGLGSHFKCASKMDVSNERSVRMIAFRFTEWRAAVIAIISQGVAEVLAHAFRKVHKVQGRNANHQLLQILPLHN